LAFDVARITPSRLIRLDRSLHVVGRLFRGVPCDDPPVHPSAACRKLRVHVQNPAKVAGLAEPKWSDGDVRLNVMPVVVDSSDLPEIPVAAGQQQFALVLARHQGGMGVIQPHGPERLGNRFVQPVGIRTSSGSEVDVERPPLLVVAQGNRRCGDRDVPELIRNDVRSHRLQVRAIGVHAVEPVFREEHDLSVRLHPGFRPNDANLFGNPSERSSRGWVALNHPYASGREAQQVVVQAGNNGQRLGPHICSQGQLDRQGPLSVAEIHPEVEISVDPLPAHVDRVVLPGEAESVAVDRPEGAVRRNRSGDCSDVLSLARLGVHPRNAAGCDGEDLLLASYQEPAGRRRSFADGDGVLVLVGDRGPRFVRQVSGLRRQNAVVERLHLGIDQHEQDFAGPACGAGDVHGNHVGDRGSEVFQGVFRQPVPASTAEATVQSIFQPRVHAPRREIPLLPIPRITHR
jgi:hypothetical protein